MVLEKTQLNHFLASSNPTHACLDSVPFHYLNFIVLIQHQHVSHMMRLGNNRHRPHQLGMESRVKPYSYGGCFTCQGLNQDTSHVGIWLRNIKGFFLLQSHLNQSNSLSILTQCQPLFSQSNSIKKHMKRYYILVITKS